MSKTTQEKEYEKSMERYNAQLDSYRALNESLMYQASGQRQLHLPTNDNYTYRLISRQLDSRSVEVRL
ncbi:MAG: hypothetical protein V5783_10380 [Pontiella sp.]